MIIFYLSTLFAASGTAGGETETGLDAAAVDEADNQT